MPTVSRKIERLINLTIALLATKRYLTKSEIFRSVDGYEGSADSKERMFERDKDDLRSLGIEIDVGSFDPLFHDEAGYRIKQESYQLNLGSVTSTELSLLSLAADAWQGASFGEAAQRVLVKLKSIGLPVDELELPAAGQTFFDGGADLPLIASAIAHSQLLHFSYRAADLTVQLRTIVPIGISTRAGFWYVTGVDQEIEELRSFRLDRVEGELATSAAPADFEMPHGFDPKRIFDTPTTMQRAKLDCRKGKGQSLRALATSISPMGEWDRIQLPILKLHSLASLILWHGEDVFVQEPEELRIEVIRALESLASHHG